MNANGGHRLWADRRHPDLTKHKTTRTPRSEVPGLAARAAALSLLDNILLDGQMLEEARGAKDPAIRAEARGLADITLRRLGQIDEILGQFIDRMPKGSGLQILRLMAAELVFKGTPAHAAVDLAVRLSRSNKRTSRLAGMVNAVGRKVAAAGQEIAADQDEAALNMPGWLSHALAQDWGSAAQANIAAAHLIPAPHDLTLKQSGDLGVMAAEVGAHALPNGSLRLTDRPQISTLPGYEAGAWWVQDAAATLPVRLLGDVAGQTVLDLCAAPGGKTLQLAAAGAKVTAVDISERRLGRVSENLSRTHLQAEIITADILQWAPEIPPDAILLDAPCSATGTLRRHPDLAHRGNPKRQRHLHDLQAAMLDRAFEWLPPKGTLVFCTCSLLKSEGEDQVEAFLERTPEATILPCDPKVIPAEFITARGTLRTRPDQWIDLGGLDGFFACAMTRTT